MHPSRGPTLLLAGPSAQERREGWDLLIAPTSLEREYGRQKTAATQAVKAAYWAAREWVIPAPLSSVRLRHTQAHMRYGDHFSASCSSFP